ncbi:MAG: MaoC family dehydratase [Promethearchaeota archaeon]|jgi:acyl dehydratase
MVTISELKVGQVFKEEFDALTRDLLKDYAKASGDTNPIHINDAVAEAAGLKGVIAHGLFSFGFISKLFEDLLEHGKYGKILEFEVRMSGYVRVGDKLVTEATIEKIEGKRAIIKVTQTSFTKVDIKDSNGNIVEQFEAGERGYISEKDINRGLVKTKEIESGTLTYRKRVAISGNAIIELNN